MNFIVTIIKNCKSKKKTRQGSAPKVELFNPTKGSATPITFNTLGINSHRSPRPEGRKFGDGHTQHGSPKNEPSMAEAGELLYYS